MSNNEPATKAPAHAVCTDCGGQISPGDLVTRAGVFAPWCHVTCPATKFDFDPADVCPDCFIVRSVNGECAC